MDLNPYTQRIIKLIKEFPALSVDEFRDEFSFLSEHEWVQLKEHFEVADVIRQHNTFDRYEKYRKKQTRMLTQRLAHKIENEMLQYISKDVAKGSKDYNTFALEFTKGIIAGLKRTAEKEADAEEIHKDQPFPDPLDE